jgi:Adenylate and Guanylate cyclase catalytic domain
MTLDIYSSRSDSLCEITGSARDPCQVFTLLETLYGAFDAVARKRGVFKVETIGYVLLVGSLSLALSL